MKNKYSYEDIEAYFLNRMSTGDREDFEIELLVNNDLQEEVKRQQVEHLAMEILLEDRLRKKMNKWQVEVELRNNSSESSVANDNLNSNQPKKDTRSTTTLVKDLVLFVCVGIILSICISITDNFTNKNNRRLAETTERGTVIIDTVVKDDKRLVDSYKKALEIKLSEYGEENERFEANRFPHPILQQYFIGYK